jgi:three-Cys-motif partner protein
MVCVLDGYAGPGNYDDGTPGSPRITVNALELFREQRRVRGLFVERDDKYFAALDALCREPGFELCRAFHGSLADHLDECLREAADYPLLAFLDPFGLTLPFADVVRILERPYRSGTELLLNVSISAIRRNAGHLTSSQDDPTYLKARPKLLRRMDDALGGDWWRAIWLRDRENGARHIALEYTRRLAAAAGGWAAAVVDVSTGNPCTSPDAPLKTVTTGDHHALVAAFLTKHYSSGGQWQRPDVPLHTIPTLDRFGLVTVELDGEPYVIADIGMRMLQPRELARAQGFEDTYVLTGSKREQVARIGNSVCPPVARAVVAALFGPEALEAAA